MSATTPSKPSILNLFACKCPRFRKGNMFTEQNPRKLKKTMNMNDTCAVCGQPFNLEAGFCYGAGYVAYALTVALSVATLVAWWLFIGFSYNDNRFLYWIISNAALLIALQPYLMQVSRTGWLAFFVRYIHLGKPMHPSHWKEPIKTLKTTSSKLFPFPVFTRFSIDAIFFRHAKSNIQDLVLACFLKTYQ